MGGPRFTDVIASLPATVPFVGPEAIERATGRAFAARIGANENVFGPSPAAVAAMAEALSGVWTYGDPENHDLKAALAEKHGVAPENIVIGEGIDGLLGLLVRLLVSPGTPVVVSRGGYPTFNYHVSGFGGRFVAVPYREDDREDLDGLAAAARESGAPLVYVANPDNPMGTWHDAEALNRMIAGLPEDTVLCLDEAYIEFAPEGTAPPIDVADPRVIRMRTFSKAYGLAGMRVGYAIGHRDLIAAFDKVRNHFGVNKLGQIAALAALQDGDWLAETVRRVRASCEEIAAIARDCGLNPLPTATNFVAIDTGRDGTFARRVVEEMGRRGVFIRMAFGPPQNRCIRISAGLPEHLELLRRTLPEALKAAEDAQEERP